jgi:hypothetical protein
MIVGFKKGKLIMISKKIRMIPKTYYIVDGYEFDGKVLFEILNNIVTFGCDVFIVNDYPDEIKALVNLEYLSEVAGSTLVVDNNGKAKKLFDEMLKL